MKLVLSRTMSFEMRYNLSFDTWLKEFGILDQKDFMLRNLNPTPFTGAESYDRFYWQNHKDENWAIFTEFAVGIGLLTEVMGRVKRQVPTGLMVKRGRL